MERGRYQSLTIEFEIKKFIQKIDTKLRELDLTQVADKMLENKDRVIEYFIKNNWTKADMKDHVWGKSEYNFHMLGKTKDNLLKNTNGVSIYDGVCVGYWNKYANAIKPYICCTKDELIIYE